MSLSMTNSEQTRKANKILEEISRTLSEEYLYSQIDEPIERVLTNFQFDDTEPVTHQYFLHAIGEFVYYIHKDGLRLRQTLSKEQACAKALSILNKGYRNQDAQGYHAAYSDACDEEVNGLGLVITQMAEIIIGLEKDEYIQWVFASRLEPLEWSTKCPIAEILTERWKMVLPPSLLRCSPSQLAFHLPELISMHLHAEKAISKMLTKNISLTVF
jgi:hypothetical protein